MGVFLSGNSPSTSGREEMIPEVEGQVCGNSKYIDGHGNHRLKEG
jgi:hypothetical protein